MTVDNEIQFHLTDIQLPQSSVMIFVATGHTHYIVPQIFLYMVKGLVQSQSLRSPLAGCGGTSVIS